MGRTKIPADAWQAATMALLRYQESKAEMRECEEESTTRDPAKKCRGPKPAHPDPTAAAAMQLSDNVKYQRLKRETHIVEEATKGLTDSELEVIRRRFWTHSKGHRHTCPYEYMQGLGYERAQMQRIARKVIIRIAQQMGEI